MAFFDSEKDELVGQREIEDKRSKQATSFLAKKQGLNSVKMLQSILASSLVFATSDALRPDCSDMAADGDLCMTFLPCFFCMDQLAT